MFLIVIVGGQERVLTLPEHCDLNLLRNHILAEFSISAPVNEIFCEYAGEMLQDGELRLQGVVDGGNITARRRVFSASDIPPGATPAQLIQIGIDHPQVLNQIDTEVASLMRARDEAGLRTFILRQTMRGFKGVYERQKEMNQLASDPDNPDNQRRIAEMIQLERINEAHAFAMENNPEAFAAVFMLYVNVSINNAPLKAFVDSGAQMTIMSKDCAERCGLLRLMDTRYAGIASGVGTGKILGKIHMVQMKLGNSFFPISVTVLEDNNMECLFGLDTLKRYRCCIDLSRNTLRLLDGSNGPEEVPFLSEHEIPKREREVGASDGDVAMDADSAIGPNPSPATSTTSSIPLSSIPSSEQVITQLMAMTDCSREQVSLALAQSDGNPDLAATLLTQTLFAMIIVIVAVLAYTGISSGYDDNGDKRDTRGVAGGNLLLLSADIVTLESIYKYSIKLFASSSGPYLLSRFLF